MQLLSFIASKTDLPVNGIENTIQLFNDDCTIPFISRYRKERTGNLDEVQIGEIFNFKKQFEELDKRKTTILKSIAEQVTITDELKKQILSAIDLNTLEDLYLPFKRKRKTKAEKARLTKELDKLNKLVAAGEGKLKNKKFVDSAPAKIVEGARKQLADTTEKRDETKRILESL